MKKINIHLIEVNNVDCASLDVQKIDGCFKIYFWDGYSQSEVIEVSSEKDAAKTINNQFIRQEMIELANIALNREK